MSREDVPNLQEVLVASSDFPRVAGFYPGSGPDGSGETDAPDGPFKPISPMTFAVDHRHLPSYILEAVMNAESQADKDDPEALEKALMKELEAMGVDPADVGLGEPSTSSRKASGEKANKPSLETDNKLPQGREQPLKGGSKPESGSTPSTG